jgi:hypothetical protein
MRTLLIERYSNRAQRQEQASRSVIRYPDDAPRLRPEGPAARRISPRTHARDLGRAARFHSEQARRSLPKKFSTSFRFNVRRSAVSSAVNFKHVFAISIPIVINFSMDGPARRVAVPTAPVWYTDAGLGPSTSSSLEGVSF